MQPSDLNSLDWHFAQWGQLFPGGKLDLSRLPHGLLLTGVTGRGKRQFALQLSRLLLCESPCTREHIEACGKCQACRWFLDGNHPDFRQVTADGEDSDADSVGDPKEKKKGGAQIKIDAIRALEDFVFVGSHRHGNRVIVIERAESMNAPAANALLKILEEPPAKVYFVITTDRIRSLLATIRSRCQLLHFRPPAANDWPSQAAKVGLANASADDLAVAGGAPMTLLRWKEEELLPVLRNLDKSLGSSGPKDALALAALWDGMLKKHVHFDMELLVDHVLRHVFDRALILAADTMRFHIDAANVGRGPNAVARAWPELLRFKRSARHPLNQTLFLEDLATHVLRSLDPKQ